MKVIINRREFNIWCTEDILDLLDLTKSKLEWKKFEFPNLKARILWPNREIWKTGSANGWFQERDDHGLYFEAIGDCLWQAFHK